MRKFSITIGALVLAIAAGGAALYLSAGRSPQTSQSRQLHTFMHIGCLHHNHGPKWHQDHGRIFNGQRRNAQDDE